MNDDTIKQFTSPNFYISTTYLNSVDVHRINGSKIIIDNIVLHFLKFAGCWIIFLVCVNYIYIV